MTQNNFFIVIEGIDRSGKSTVMKLLIKKIKKEFPELSPIGIEYPDRSTETGKILDKYLKKEIKLEKHASHLLFSANRWEKNEDLKKLTKENIVLSSRYYFSGIAYSVAGLDIDLNWARKPDQGLVEPDLLIFIDTPVCLVVNRKNFGQELYDKVDIQEKIYLQLKKICTEHPNHRIIDGNKDLDAMVEDAFSYVKELL